MYGTDSHWEITTSSGRRVSLLCDDGVEHSYSSSSSTSAPTPPLSPDHRQLYRPYRANSASSTSSSLRSISPHRMYSPPTPPSLSLPRLEKLPLFQEGSFSPPLSASSRSGSISTSPSLTPIRTVIEENYSPTVSASMSTISNPPSPKSSSAAAPVIKRTSRRYTCQCGKSFTTSGHLARHTRIHTGEKNYVCPEAGCGARFSRQDNCMQHYRTHQSGSASKRAARRRRMSADSAMGGTASSLHDADIIPVSVQQRTLSFSSSQSLNLRHLAEPFGAETGLAALATVAIAAYP